jgi:hypothetical protein
MTTYEDNLLAARFAALAPEPLPGDWDDVLDRAGAARKHPRPRVVGHLKGRRRYKVAVAFVALTVVAVAGLFVDAPWKSSPGFLERAQAALTPPEGTILHAKWELTRTSRDFGCAVRVGPNELWADLTFPYRYRWIDHNVPADVEGRRAIACADDTTAELGGDSSGLLKFVPPNRLTNFGPGRVGATWDDVSNLREALATGRAHDAGRTELEGREVARIRVDNCLDPPCAGPQDYWYVDPETFLPVAFEWPSSYHVSTRPDGGGLLHFDLAGRYLTYEYLPRTAANLALTDIRAQHPDAKVATTEGG